MFNNDVLSYNDILSYNEDILSYNVLILTTLELPKHNLNFIY